MLLIYLVANSFGCCWVWFAACSLLVCGLLLVVFVLFLVILFGLAACLFWSGWLVLGVFLFAFIVCVSYVLLCLVLRVLFCAL